MFYLFLCFLLLFKYIHKLNLIVDKSFPFCKAEVRLLYGAPFFVRQSAIWFSLLIQLRDISPLSFISLIADISTRSLLSVSWLVVLALSCKDLLSVYVLIGDDG